jgi:protein TonB
MKPALNPIAVTTMLSLALHATILFGFVQTRQAIQSTGKGIHIELVSSSDVSKQPDTTRAADIEAVNAQQQAQTGQRREPAKAIVAQTQRPERAVSAAVTKSEPEPVQLISEKKSDSGADMQTRSRSSKATTHTRSIIELLHSTISERKQYPYLARRQRREGVARIEFVLHPDGSIDDARLIHSSKTRILDKAALEAVKGIVPFEPARAYLDRPEAFQVDVIFNMI